MVNLALMDDPMQFPSRIKSGKHCAVFIHHHRLYVELDGPIVEEATPLNAIRLLAEEMQQFRDSHPLIAFWAAILGPAIPAAVLNKWKTILIWYKLLKATGSLAGAGTVLTAVGIILVYEIILLTARWIEIRQTHKCSNDGGVIIEVRFPYVQLQSQVWPRGGFTGERIEKGIEMARTALDKFKQSNVHQAALNVSRKLKDARRNPPWSR